MLHYGRLLVAGQSVSWASRVLAQGAATLGISVPELVVGLAAILAAVVGPLVTALVKMSGSKDDAIKGQAEAHRGERDGLMKALAEKDKFIERLVDARAKDQHDASEARARDAAEARASIVQVTSEAMRVVDSIRITEVDMTTPTSPVPRDSRTSVNPMLPEMSGQNTRKGGAGGAGGRKSNA